MAIRTPAMIIHLLHSKKVVKFEDIQNALGAASRATVFRYLKQVQYVRSYNYNGCYYTNREPTLFDRWGLYSYRDISFSRDGKLDKTVTRLVCESKAGLTQRELRDLLKVRVQVLLLKAVLHKKIYREKVGGFYLYLHNVPNLRESQLQVRQSRIVTNPPSETKDYLQVDFPIVIKGVTCLNSPPRFTPWRGSTCSAGACPSDYYGAGIGCL